MALDDIAANMETWNKEVFSSILYRKQRLKPKLKGIEKALEVRHFAFLEKLELNLKQDYERVLWLEEIFWGKKARCNWLSLGDRNI